VAPHRGDGVEAVRAERPRHRQRRELVLRERRTIEERLGPGDEEDGARRKDERIDLWERAAQGREHDAQVLRERREREPLDDEAVFREPRAREAVELLAQEVGVPCEERVLLPVRDEEVVAIPRAQEEVHRVLDEEPTRGSARTRRSGNSVWPRTTAPLISTQSTRSSPASGRAPRSSRRSEADRERRPRPGIEDLRQVREEHLLLVEGRLR
jgi:hypothetical protein